VKVTDEKSRIWISYSEIRIPRIRIRTKMSRILNTVSQNNCLPLSLSSSLFMHAEALPILAIGLLGQGSSKLGFLSHQMAQANLHLLRREKKD
jgi:hypothetical protein